MFWEKLNRKESKLHKKYLKRIKKKRILHTKKLDVYVDKHPRWRSVKHHYKNPAGHKVTITTREPY